MRRRAVLEEIDDALGFGQPVGEGGGRSRGEGRGSRVRTGRVLIQHRRQRSDAKARGTPAKELAAVEVELVFEEGVHP